MIHNKQLQAIFGLTYNPFGSNIPADHIWLPPRAELFIARVVSLVSQGGFALISGDSGLGKSKLLQALAARLASFNDLVVAVFQRPHSSLSDFYRELGECFGLDLTPRNRWGGFKSLRAKWREHIAASLYRPVILIDEAQGMQPQCLEEIRLLSSASFDSESILTIILCGDPRLPENLGTRELIPLGTRIKARYILEPFSPQELLDFLEYSLSQAGGDHLMTQQLKTALSEHAAGNLRILTTMANDLLFAAADKNLPSLDEKLYHELFAVKTRPRQRPVLAERKAQ
jgi:type II secretory pathway predicted ATPase ExeA